MGDLSRWKTSKCFQHWSSFSGDLPVYEIHESDFNTGLIFRLTYLFLKYMKVIYTLVSFSRWPTQVETWKCFQHWFYFSCDLPDCEIHESDFNTSQIFKVTYLFFEIHKSDFNLGLIFQVTRQFMKYMEVISKLVLFSRWPNLL